MNQYENIQESDQDLRRFLLKEYDNIAAAHFNSNENITNFFKHYLLIFSIPITVFATLVNLSIVQESFVNKPNYLQIPILILGIVFLIISFAGFSIYMYVLNLHHDGIYYARTINAIRKYFFDKDKTIESNLKHRYRVLPQSPLLPSYRNLHFFLPILFVFLLFNSVYFFVFLLSLGFFTGRVVIISGNIDTDRNFIILVVILTAIFAVIHLLRYMHKSNSRDLNYLRSNIIGIDIDGVINNQREHFCKVLEENAGIKLLPDNINHIPVSKIPNANITGKDEISVFNDPNYWIKLPPKEYSQEILNKISKSLSLEIYLFTHRPWPTKEVTANERKEWKIKSKEFRNMVFGKFPLRINYFLIKIKTGLPFKVKMLNSFSIFNRKNKIRNKKPYMEIITRCWLKKHNYSFNRILVEKYSELVSEPSPHINRFFISRNIPVRFFVEDDLHKAVKLSFICDYVFLIDQPYNQSENIPENIMRVSTWIELYEQLKIIC